MALFIPEYDGLRIHDIMLSDVVRTGTYKEAIESNVKNGDIVIDNKLYKMRLNMDKGAS